MLAILVAIPINLLVRVNNWSREHPIPPLIRDRNTFSIDGRQKLMTTFDFIIQLFCLVDHQLTAADQNQQQTQAKLYPSEVVTLALLFSLQGVGHRPFYRWIVTDYKLWFSKLASPKPLVPSVQSVY